MKATAKTYENLKALLDKEKFPKPYIYKFIILTDTVKEQEVKDCFEKTAKFTLTFSKNKKYTTISILDKMPSSQSIIDKYLMVGKIKNVIHL